MYALWLREFKVFQREKSRVIGSVASPIVFLLTLGSGLGATTTFTDPRYAAFPYQQFMFPGIIGMTVLFGTIFYGMGIIWDRRLDVLKEVLVAPVSRTTIFFGKVLGGCTEALVQAALLLVIAVILYHPPWPTLLLAIPFALLLAILFVSIGLFIGSFFTSYEGFNLVMSFLTFPAVFLSGAFYPVDKLPPILGGFVLFNPATYAVDGLRGAILGPHAFNYAIDVAVLAVWCVVFLFAGTWAFKRMT